MKYKKDAFIPRNFYILHLQLLIYQGPSEKIGLVWREEGGGQSHKYGGLFTSYQDQQWPIFCLGLATKYKYK